MSDSERNALNAGQDDAPPLRDDEDSAARTPDVIASPPFSSSLSSPHDPGSRLMPPRSVAPTASESRSALAISRTLLFGWCVWLLGSWAVNLTIDAPHWIGGYGNMTPGDLYIPAVRGMMQSVLLGLAIAWPAWRLSERVRAYGPVGVQVAVDLAAMLLIIQVVLWPLQYVVHWAFEQTLLIMMTLVVWSWPLGMAVWIGRRRATRTARAGAMAACMAMLVGGWIAAAAFGSAEAALWSPTVMLWELCGRVTLDMVMAITRRLIIVAFASTAVWVVLRVTIARRG